MREAAITITRNPANPITIFRTMIARLLTGMPPAGTQSECAGVHVRAIAQIRGWCARLPAWYESSIPALQSRSHGDIGGPGLCGVGRNRRGHPHRSLAHLAETAGR